MNNGTYAVSYNLNYKNPEASSRTRIILVGTAHVSDKSVAEVNEVIDREKPDIIAVELDKGRFKTLKGDEKVNDNVKDFLSEKNFSLFLLHWLLAYVQKKIGADTGVKPGAEILSAIERAEKTGAQIALIDRDIQITLRRFLKKMSFFEKLKLFGSLAGATVGIGTQEIDMDTITDDDVVTQLIEELRKIAPTAASVLLDERNAIMAKNLIDLSRDGNTVVAVIGAGHRTGIQNYLDAPETIPPTQELMSLPKKGFSWFKAIFIAFFAMVIGMFGLLIYSNPQNLSIILTALLYLFITQGIFSAIGVLFARGHPASALTAFGLAWFGFLHPFLAVGWIAGIVEAHFRSPTTDDFKNIMKTETMTELMQNKLFRIILVAGMANLGSMIGTFVAIPIMVHYLGITNPLDILKTALETGFNAIKGLL